MARKENFLVNMSVDRNGMPSDLAKQLRRKTKNKYLPATELTRVAEHFESEREVLMCDDSEMRDSEFTMGIE